MQPSNPDPNFGAGGNPYGQAPEAANPYSPPAEDPWSDTNVNFDEVPQGTYGGGFAVGFFFALLGLIIVHFAGKEETKRGALHGFGVRFGLGLLFVLFSLAAG